MYIKLIRSVQANNHVAGLLSHIIKYRRQAGALSSGSNGADPAAYIVYLFSNTRVIGTNNSLQSLKNFQLMGLWLVWPTRIGTWVWYYLGK